MMMKYLQNLGKSLMLPVAVLPAAAILMGIGYWIDPDVMLVEDGNTVATFLVNGGEAIIDNIAILFAVGIALGMAKERDGSAALSGLVAFLVITNVLDVAGVAGLKGIEESGISDAFDHIDNAFIGILSGLMAATMYNRFSHVQLPNALAFFSGKRLVPIMTSVLMMITSIVLLFVWPFVYEGLVTFGEWMSKLGPTGAGLYGFFNRLLIPTGLHHALNSVFWFDVAGIDDIARFWSGDGVKGITGRYLAGFFPIMMFGLPGAALAMYHTAKTKRKKQAASLLLAAGFAAFFTGVTEPLEFSFMFLAPALYVVHAVLAGLSLFIAALFHWTAGFAFSAGFVDLFLSSQLPLANKPYMLVAQGLVFFGLYYVVFRFLITKFNFKTPGREDDDVAVESAAVASSGSGKNEKFADMAAIIYDGLGGDDNVQSIDYCASRLRVEVKNMDNVDQSKIKSAGIPGINVVGEHNIQVVVGTTVQFVYDEVAKLRNS